jgi:hypothetical protein
MPTALSFFGLKSNPLDNVAWAVLALITLPLGTWIAWKRWRFMTIMVLLYGLALIIWPWPFERFVSPISGLLYTMIGAGALHLARGRSAGVQGLALATVALLFVAGSAQTNLPALNAMMACDRSNPSESPTCFSEDRRGLLQLARYARENTPRDAVFFVSKEAGFYWHTDRRSVRSESFRRVPTDSLGAVLRRRGVTYAVVSPVGTNRGVHNRAIARACREFESVASFDGDAVLLRLRPGPIDHDDATCQLIAEWTDGVSPRWPQ